MHKLDMENAQLRQALAHAQQQLLELNQQRQQYKTMLDHIPALIGFWDAGLLNRYANHAYQDWIGKQPHEITGRHIRDVLGEHLYTLNLQYMESALAGQAQRFERVVPNPQTGTQRISQADYIPYVDNGKVDGFFVLVADISAQKEAEMALLTSQQVLRESEARYRAVVTDQTDIISRWRADGSYVFANEVFCRFFGKQLDDLISSHWTPLVHPDDLQRVTAELARLSKDNPVINIENRVINGAQQMCWMQFSNRGFFSDSGELLEIQSVGRDISERKLAEAKLLRLNNALTESQGLLRAMAAHNQARIESERKHYSREVHDELGQILTALRMDLLFLEMKYCALDPGLRHKVQDMKALLDTAFQAVRHVAANLRPVALDLGLPAALRWLCTEFSRKSGVACHFELQADPGPGAVPTAQALQEAKPDETTAMVLFRIVQESLTNITRYAQASLVTVRLGMDAGALQVRVQDDGVGFDEETTPQEKCYGLLGMQERTLALGGSIRIASELGHGTCIAVSVPYVSQVQGSAA